MNSISNFNINIENLINYKRYDIENIKNNYNTDDNIDYIINKLNEINLDIFYKENILSIKKNYELSFNYLDYDNRLIEIINTGGIGCSCETQLPSEVNSIVIRSTT